MIREKIRQEEEVRLEWMEVTIYTTTAGVEPVTGNLLQYGVGGFAVEDAQDFKEFLEDVTPNWDYVDESLMALEHCETKVKLYLPATAQGMETLGLVRGELAAMKARDSRGLFGRLEISLDNLNEEDWSTAWKKYYTPTRVGRHLLVCPSWETCDRQEGDTVITLDPGMAFGTGTHHTTRLCMELLEDLVRPGCRVLDVGCGSGILAVTALLLGAGEAVGCDIDETAVKVARENAALNGVGERVSFHQGDLAEKVTGTFDIVTANIVADVIIRLCPEVGRFMGPGAAFVCSGIIDERREDVERALKENGLTPFDVREAGGWAAIASRR